MPIPRKKQYPGGELSVRREKRAGTLQAYVTDPVSRPTQSFPFQHAHAPKKEADSHRTENRLIQIHLTTQTNQQVSVRSDEPQRKKGRTR